VGLQIDHRGSLIFEKSEKPEDNMPAEKKKAHKEGYAEG
jgi:hypothetical protein